jgi:two-component system, NtrC family, sensor histidine kinase HydH
MGVMSLKKLIQIEFSPNQKLNYPILGLLVATFVLLLVVGFLTYLNYNREEELLKDHLKRQGITVIRALEAASRSGMMDMMWGDNQIRSLFRETAKGPNIDRILLVDKNGEVITDSGPDSSDWQAEKLVLPISPKETFTVIYEKKSNINIFRVIRTYDPITNNPYSQKGWMDNCCNGSSESSPRYIVLDLKMQEYQAAQDEDVRLAVFSGLILFIIGSAALYFLLLAQNYYVASRTLKTMESYTRNVVESMPNGLISLDKEQCIETINRNAILLLKLDGSQIIGRPLGEVLSNCKLPETFLPGENIFQKQVECHLNDGTTIPLSTTSSQLRDETGQVIGSVIMLRDLREIRSLEKQVERSERLASLGRMAAGIAHEIRNPLGSIKGFAQYFRNKFSAGSEDQNYATVMVNEVDRLNRVIQDLLNFAKPQEPKLGRVDLQSIIRHSLNLVLPELRSKNIKIVENIAGGPSIIIADADMITQVFLNLFLNAIEAIERDGEIGISLMEKNEQYEISVRDSGGGITEENLPHIFDPFFTSKKDGTGLGLAVVYRIIENHNGTIEVESKIPSGTSFHIVFWKAGHIKTGVLNET